MKDPKTSTNKPASVGLRLSRELYKRLADAAQKTNMNKGEIVSEVLDKWLDAWLRGRNQG